MSTNNAIGTGAVVITADADQMTAGLTKASGDLKKWAKDSGKIAAGAGGAGIGAGLATAVRGGGVGGALAGLGAGIGTLIAPGIGTAIGGAIGGGAGGFFDDATKSIREMAFKGRQADALGVSSDQFEGLGLAYKKAGLSADAVGPSFIRLGKNITDAAQGGSAKATAAFANIGVSANELAGLPLDQSFLKIADAISQLGSPAQQADAAIAVFGKSGGELLPVLQQGSAGLQEFIDKQKALGTVVDEKDMAAVQQAAKAIPKITAAMDGLWNRIVVAVAPVIEVVGNGLTKALEAVQPVLRWIGEASKAFFAVWGVLLDEVISLIKDVAGGIGKWISETLGLKDTTVTAGGIVLGVLRGVGIALAYVWDTLKAGAGVVAYVTSFVVDGFGMVLKGLAAVVDMARQLPGSVRPDWVGDLAEGLDATSAKVAIIGDGMRDWGKNAVNGFGNSADDVRAWFDKIKRKLEERPEPKKQKPVVGAGGPEVAATGKDQLAGALQKGSKEAYSAIVRFQSDLMFSRDDVPKQQLGALNKIDGKLGDIKDLLSKQSDDEDEF